MIPAASHAVQPGLAVDVLCYSSRPLKAEIPNPCIRRKGARSRPIDEEKDMSRIVLDGFDDDSVRAIDKWLRRLEGILQEQSPELLLRRLEKLLSDTPPFESGYSAQRALREWNKVEETAGWLNLSPAYVRTLLNKGTLRGTKTGFGAGGAGGGEWTISRGAIEDYERRRRKPKDDSPENAA
jgi:hypothetical protein